MPCALTGWASPSTTKLSDSIGGAAREARCRTRTGRCPLPTRERAGEGRVEANVEVGREPRRVKVTVRGHEGLESMAGTLRDRCGLRPAPVARDRALRVLDARCADHRLSRRRLGGRPRAGTRLANASAALTGRPRLDARWAAGVDVVWLPAPAPVAVSRRRSLRAHRARPLAPSCDPATSAPTPACGTAPPGRAGSRGGAARVIADSEQTRARRSSAGASRRSG